MIAIARKRVSDEALMEALMPGSAGGDVAPATARPAQGDLDQGPDAGRRLSSRAMLPPDPRRPHRRPSARGRGDRGPRHRLRHARERHRRRLARPCLGRGFGRRRGAARGHPARYSGRARHDVRHSRREARQHHQPSAGPPRRQLPDLPPRHRGPRPRAPCTRSSRRCATPNRSARSSGSSRGGVPPDAAGARGVARRPAPPASRGPTRSPSSAQSAPAARGRECRARARFRRQALAAAWPTGWPTAAPA